MKTPAEILGKTENGLPQPSWISKTPTGNEKTSSVEPKAISNETKTLVNMIFARFMAIYGHKFKSCFETQDEIRIAKREWALSIAGIPESVLVRAVDRCKETLAWMPTVSEFLAIAEAITPDDGIPSVFDAYTEAARYADQPSQHHWSHTVVYHAGKETGWFRVRSEEREQVFPIFKYNYQQLVTRYRQGDALDDPIPAAIENKEDNSLFSFIKGWSKLHSQDQLSEEQAASLLYYLTKPEGSRARAMYQQQSAKKLKALSLDIELPNRVEPLPLAE